MGHSEEISKNFYQTPQALATITKVGKILEAADGGFVKPTMFVPRSELPTSEAGGKITGDPAPKF